MENQEKKKSGFSTAGLVLSIIGICTSFMPIINNISFVLGVLAIIFAIIALIKKDSKVKNIIILIIGLLAIVITLNSQKALSDSLDDLSKDLDTSVNNATGKNTEDILNNYVDVSLGEFEVIEEEYFSKTKLTVKVTNKASEKKSYSIQIEAVSEDGSRIAQDYVYANDLNAGQSQSFDIFTFVSSDKLESMKNATFKIVEVSMY